jgi:hypothetical protein
MKIINWTQYMEAIREHLQKQTELLKDKELNTESVTFTVKADMFLGKQVQRPLVEFSPTASMKAMYLLMACADEIAAHGVVKRDGNNFLIEDIYIYPQEIASTTVDMKDEYVPWLYKFPDDIFNRIRFQMHSHVNMPCSPSGVDNNTYAGIMKNVTDFYIFMILNKKVEFNIMVYDFQNNVVFDKSDIDVLFAMPDGDSVGDWYKDEFKKHISYRTRYYNNSFGTGGASNVDKTTANNYLAERKAEEAKKQADPPTDAVDTASTAISTQFADTQTQGTVGTKKRDTAADDYDEDYWKRKGKVASETWDREKALKDRDSLAKYREEKKKKGKK